MTTLEIQNYIDTAVSSNFNGFTSQSEEMMTSDGGDGRFEGKVSATKYSGLPLGRDIFIAIGQTAEKAQIVKVGRSECLRPSTVDLDQILKKELGVDQQGK
jgi:hypothetical protein